MRANVLSPNAAVQSDPDDDNGAVGGCSLGTRRVLGVPYWYMQVVGVINLFLVYSSLGCDYRDRLRITSLRHTSY